MSTNGHHNAAVSSLKARVRTVNGNAAPQGLSSNGHANRESSGHGNSTMEAEAGRLLRRVLDLVLEARLVTGIDASEKVVHFRHPHELEVSAAALPLSRTSLPLMPVFSIHFITLTLKPSAVPKVTLRAGNCGKLRLCFLTLMEI